MAFQFQSRNEEGAPDTIIIARTRYHEESVASLKALLETRGVEYESNRKDDLIASLVLNDKFQMTSTNFEERGGSYSATTAIKLKEIIHSRMSGRGLPIVGEMLKNLHDNTLKDQLITILVMLDRFVVGHWCSPTPLRAIEGTLNHEELAWILNEISKCSQEHRDPARVDYISLPTKPKAQTSFVPFDRLPTELRASVWEFYFQISGRVVTFTARKPGLGIKMFTPPPASMLVNRESRKLTLKNYNHELKFVRDGPAYVNLFHFTLDTLMINERTMLYDSVSSDSPKLAQHFQDSIPSALLKGVKSLALTSADLLQFPFSLRSPDVFPDLELFTLVIRQYREKLIFEPHEHVLVNYVRSRSWWAHLSDFEVQQHINTELRRLAKQYGKGKLIIRVRESLVYKSEVWG